MERNPDLEAKLVADPRNIDNFLVYADYLQSKGDPRGELIALQHAGKAAEAEAHLEEHAEALFGPLESYRKTLDGEEKKAFEWCNGFIRSARLGYDSNCSDDAELSLQAGLEALLTHPSGILLEELVVPINMLDDGAYFEPVVKMIAKHGAPALRSLRLGEFSCCGGPGGEGDYEYEISWTGIGDASALWKAVPRLERLVLQVGLGSSSASGGARDNLGVIDLPNLRYLRVVTGGMSQSCMKSFAEARWPELTYMDLWFGSPHYGASGGIDDLAPILDGTALPKIEHLGLMNAEFTDEICGPLANAKVLPRLRELSLAYGTLTDAGARTLAAAKSALAHLHTLDLSENCLTAEGIAAIHDLCANVKTDEQKDGRGDRYVSLSE
jgi:uncharacterized protein (TIGR02996 family)